MLFVVSGMAQFQHADGGSEGGTVSMTRKPQIVIYPRDDPATFGANLVRAKNLYGHFQSLSGNNIFILLVTGPNLYLIEIKPDRLTRSSSAGQRARFLSVPPHRKRPDQHRERHASRLSAVEDRLDDVGREER